MFNLENAIAEWREQMLAAGVKTPVPLEELELHLREEIEHQITLGLDEQRAFEIAIAQIGEAGPLKKEFKRADGFLDWWGEDMQTRINRSFALLWLAYCSWVFFDVVATFAGSSFWSHLDGFRLTPDFFVILIYVFFLFWGLFNSIRLFGGNHRAIPIIRLIAILGLVAFVAQIIAFNQFSLMAVMLTVFNVLSICLLRSPKRQALNLSGT